MDSTEKFVEDLHEKQRKHEKSEKHHNKSHAGHKLPNKQHSTNK
ncbi:DUF4023 family protein [Paenibacillus septentrionalis]|uniref:DUF4023 family protein n=1 Tax=Paenibacillus septentrionalis TaxID=429342 RepID=A0ABW1V4T2_9BACL